MVVRMRGRFREFGIGHESSAGSKIGYSRYDRCLQTHLSFSSCHHASISPSYTRSSDPSQSSDDGLRPEREVKHILSWR